MTRAHWFMVFCLAWVPFIWWWAAKIDERDRRREERRRLEEARQGPWYEP